MASDDSDTLQIGPLSRLRAVSMTPELWTQIESLQTQDSGATQICKLIVDRCTNVKFENLQSASEVLIAIAAVGTQSEWNEQQANFVANLIIPMRDEFAERDLVRNPAFQKHNLRHQAAVNENQQLQELLDERKPGHFGLIVNEVNRRVKRVGYEQTPEIQFPRKKEISGQEQSPDWHTFQVAYSAAEQGANRDTWLNGYPGDTGGRGPDQSKRRVKAHLQKIGLSLSNGPVLKIVEWDGK